MTAADGIVAYHLLEAARDLFQLPPAKLTFGQRMQAESRAQEALSLESMILAVPEAAGVTLPDDRLERSWAEITERYGDETALARDLAENGLSATDMKKALARQLRAETVLEKIAADQAAPVAEDKVRAAYDARAERLIRPESRDARHILITVNADFPDNTPERARERIEALCDQLGPTPSAETVADAAVKHSECPSALEGGVIGNTITPGHLYPEIDQALFALDPGALSRPVTTEIGLHLVYCERLHAAGPIPYDEIAPKLRTALERAEQKKAKQAWLARLRGPSPTDLVDRKGIAS